MGWRVHHSGCCGILKFGDAIVPQKPDFSDMFFENSCVSAVLKGMCLNTKL